MPAPPGWAIGSAGTFRYDDILFLRRSACMYRAVTRQIEVTVEPNFLPGRSSVEKSQYFWSYTIVITNSGKETGRTLRIHLGCAAADHVRLHDRALSDGDRERRAVRNRRADILARQPRQQAGVELG
jgi:hypothetical protein